MSNETKQTAIEKFIEKLEELGDLRDCTSIGVIQLNIYKNEYIELKRQAKEMEVSNKEKSYADGYSAGYDRALELVEWKIKHELKIDNK